MNDIELKQIIESKLKQSITESSGLESDQLDSMDAYNGEAYGNEMEGRSHYVSRDCMEQVEWALPQLMKVFASSSRYVEFEPESIEDEAQAEHETDVVNHIFMKSGGYQVFYDWFKTALIQKVGYIKVYYDYDTKVETETLRGLPESRLPELTEDPEVEILSSDEQEVVDVDEFGQQVFSSFYDIEFRRKTKVGKICVDVIPNEEMRVSKDAKSIDLDKVDFVAHETQKTVSDCLEMGWDKQTILDAISDEDDDFYRGDYEDGEDDEHDESRRTVKVVEAYLYCDYDGDGISEYRRVVKVGSEIVENDPWDECPFDAITPFPMPHQHVGKSLVDQVADLQYNKTMLMRGITDNLHLTNNPEKEVLWSQVNGDDLLRSAPGGIKRVKQMGSIREIAVPFTAGASIPYIEMLDRAKESRTGISRHTMGLDPDALAQSTKGAFMGAMKQANIRLESIARQFAEDGVKGMFRKIHALLVDNEKSPINLRINSQWQQANPDQWHKRKDPNVNVGLGTGNKDESLTRLVQLAEKQGEMLMAGSPLVTQKNLYNTLARIIEDADLKEPSLFFTNPDTLPPPQPKPPSVEEQIAQAQIQLAMLQARAQEEKNKLEQQKLELQILVEQEKVKDAERDVVADQQNIALKAQSDSKKAELEEAKLAADIQAKHKELEIKEKQLQLEAEKQAVDINLAIQDSIKPLMEQITTIQQSLPTRKAIIRDKNGDIVGIE